MKVANLDEFWDGQKNLKLLDPNITACPDWRELFEQLIDSKARIDFTQGVDIRTMTSEKAEMIRQMRIKTIHFAWDRYEDGRIVKERLKEFKDTTGWHRSKIIVYLLTNFDTTIEQDLERIYAVRDLGCSPDVRIYNKQSLQNGHILRRMQRWVNAPRIFYSVRTFEEYKG